MEGDEAVLEGELTIKGNTNPVTARGAYGRPHEDFAGNTRIGLSFETVVDRTQYGLNWNVPLPRGGDALGTQVRITAHLELVAK
jgi:polyisoprenoid-binding protein YceI